MGLLLWSCGAKAHTLMITFYKPRWYLFLYFKSMLKTKSDYTRLVVGVIWSNPLRSEETNDHRLLTTTNMVKNKVPLQTECMKHAEYSKLVWALPPPCERKFGPQPSPWAPSIKSSCPLHISWETDRLDVRGRTRLHPLPAQPLSARRDQNLNLGLVNYFLSS